MGTVASTPWGVLETVFTNHLDLIISLTKLVLFQLGATPNLISFRGGCSTHKFWNFFCCTVDVVFANVYENPLLTTVDFCSFD